MRIEQQRFGTVFFVLCRVPPDAIAPSHEWAEIFAYAMHALNYVLTVGLADRQLLPQACWRCSSYSG